MVRVSPLFDPLLRRPFGILESRPPVYLAVFPGPGPRHAAALQDRPGDRMDILGPLGNVFPELPGKNVLLIAGGRGIVPLFSYAKTYAASASR